VERNGPFVYYKIPDLRSIEILKKLDELATDLLTNRKMFYVAVAIGEKLGLPKSGASLLLTKLQREDKLSKGSK
jgi:hypothetical protein